MRKGLLSANSFYMLKPALRPADTSPMAEGDNTRTSTTAWLKQAASAPGAAPETETPTTTASGLPVRGARKQAPDVVSTENGYTGVVKDDELTAMTAILEAERHASQASANLNLTMRPTWDTPAQAPLTEPMATGPQPTPPVLLAHPEDVANHSIPGFDSHVDRSTGQPRSTADDRATWAPPVAAAGRHDDSGREVLSPRAEKIRTREKHQGKRRGFFRRPAVVLEEASSQTFTPINPSILPPPTMYGGGGSSGPKMTPSEERRAVKRAKRAGIVGTQPNAMSMVFDPGKIRTEPHRETLFVIPLIPASIVAALMTYLWFQGSIRLGGAMPWAPMFIGISVAWIMKLGTMRRDFGRIGASVFVTVVATLAGASSLQAQEPFSLARLRLDWGTVPQIVDPIEMIKMFHQVFSKSPLIGTVMLIGPIIAGIVSSIES